MKILILTDFFSSSFGGAGLVSSDEAAILKKHGHKINVITITPNNSEAGERMENGINVFRIYSDYPYKWRGYLSLYNHSVVVRVKEIIAKIKPEVIHAQNIHTYISYYCLKLAHMSGAKVFVTMHDVMAVHFGKFTEFINPRDLSIPNNFDYKINSWRQFRIFKWRYNPLRNFIIRHYLRYANKIFAVSGALKTVLNENSIENVEVLYNGIDVSSWKVSDKDISKFKQKYNLFDKKVILFSGWVNGAKGGDQMLDAMGKVIKKIPNAILLATGRMDLYYQYMQKNASDVGLADKIVFPGWLSGNDLIVSYESSDVVVFPSICFDTFGMVNLEAMCSKKPVVATCFGGAPEVVLDSKTGYIVNPYDIETMAMRITELLLDSNKAKQFGQAGYERALKYFNKDDKIKELLTHYS